MNNFTIGQRTIGPHSPAYVIAELSANHNSNLTHALKTIDAMAEAGADAVKLQTYTADTLTIRSTRPEFVVGKGTLWTGRTLHDLYQEAQTPWEWHEQLFSHARSLGLDCFSTPFDPTAVEFLETLDPPAYKIASFELVDLPLIDTVAATGKPMILSTGMASLDEIAQAVEIVRKHQTPFALLKCTSAYPSPPEAMNLKTISHLKEAFDCVAGLSDHTLGIAVPVAAVVLGARIIEKHFTLSRKTPGPDSAFSLEPDEFRDMVQAIRTAEAAIGKVAYGRTPADEASLVFRRSLYVVRDVKAGEKFDANNVRSIRPACGLSPSRWWDVLGRKATCDISAGTPLSEQMLGPSEP